MDQLEVSEFVTISTCHVSREDMREIKNQISECDDSLFPFYDGVHGVIIYIYEDATGDTEVYPDTVRPLIQWVRSLDRPIWWLRLDSDGPVVPGLEQYDW